MRPRCEDSAILAFVPIDGDLEGANIPAGSAFADKESSPRDCR